MRWPVSIWISPTPPDISCLRTEPHQFFWYHTVLRASDQIEEGIEVLVLNVTLCLFATWFFLYITMVTRIKISVLVSAPVATFLLCLGATSVPSKSPYPLQESCVTWLPSHHHCVES